MRACKHAPLSYLTLLIATMLLSLVPASALAHGDHSGLIQTFTQTVGPYELAVTIELPNAVPAPLYLSIAPPDQIGDAIITLRAAPRGRSFDHLPDVEVRSVAGSEGPYSAQLEVEQAGEWELEVRVEGAKGRGVARVPFAIVIPSPSPATIALIIALSGLFVLMLLRLFLTMIFQQRRQGLPGRVNSLLGHGVVACLIVVAVLSVQQISGAGQLVQAAGVTSMTFGRPHVNVALRTEPAASVAGQRLTLILDLSDGATGLPVDDLVPHHEALIHLVVIDQAGDFFIHLHPPRLAPGRYAIQLTPERPGRYTAYAELARQDSGAQVLARDFQVEGSSIVSTDAPAPGLGVRHLSGIQVNVISSLTPLRAGHQATLTFRFQTGAGPVQDLQPWLGMAGHLIARSADGAIFGHVHAIEPMAPGGPAPANVHYGPEVRFVYTFPQPGRYQLWGQFKHAGTIVTVPVTISVEG